MKQDTNPHGTLDLRSFVTFRLMRLQAQINAQAQHILRTYSDIGQSEWRVLALVEDRGTSNMAQVVRDGRMDKAQVSRAIKALVAKGYVMATENPDDQRQNVLSLTPAGKAVHDRVRPHMAARQHVLLAGFSDADIAHLFAMLDQLEQAAERRDF